VSGNSRLQTGKRQHVQVILQERRNLADRHAELHTDRARLGAQIVADADHRARLKMDVAGLKSELDQECARSADLKAEAEHQARESDRLSAELHRVRQPWWRRLIGDQGKASVSQKGRGTALLLNSPHRSSLATTGHSVVGKDRSRPLMIWTVGGRRQHWP
jgi:hypothetical protein